MLELRGFACHVPTMPAAATCVRKFAHGAVLACLLPLTLSACGKAETTNEATSPAASAPAAAISFAGQGRDRLCLAGTRAAFIAYAAAGDRNCSVRGALAGTTLTPDGDSTCRIAIQRKGNAITLGPVGAACAYYCAAPASFAGKTFVRMAKPAPVVDLAGDPLC